MCNATCSAARSGRISRPQQRAFGRARVEIPLRRHAAAGLHHPGRRKPWAGTGHADRAGRGDDLSGLAACADLGAAFAARRLGDAAARPVAQEIVDARHGRNRQCCRARWAKRCAGGASSRPTISNTTRRNPPMRGIGNRLKYILRAVRSRSAAVPATDLIGGIAVALTFAYRRLSGPARTARHQPVHLLCRRRCCWRSSRCAC